VDAFKTYILQVYRPEAVLDEDNVFSGIEILGFFASEERVNEEIDKYIGDHAEWKFHYEQIDLFKGHDVSTVIGRKPRLPLFDSGNPNLSKEVDEMFGSGHAG
jgi:hypothetical protein